MIFRDLLVASVAAGLGLSMIQVAFTNRGWCFDNFLVRQIEASRGRQAARTALGLGGTAMILIGVWTIVSPWLKTGSRDLGYLSTKAPTFEYQKHLQ